MIPPPLPPEDPVPEAPILRVIAATAALARELLDTLNREAQALAAMKLTAPRGFAEAKTRLVAAYGYKLEELREATMVPEAEAALAELRVLNDELMMAARHNAAAIEGAMDGNRRLLDLVVKAVSDKRAPTTVGYGRVGNRATAPRGTGPSVSMMITKSL